MLPYKLKKKYRLSEYDYSSDGYYYVTICIRNRECCLGEIINEKMQLSEIGKIVKQEWLKTPEIRSNVNLDEWVIMPNHIHGVIVICSPEIKFVGTGRRPVPTRSRFGMVASGSLSTIIGSFKSAVSKRCHRMGFSDFAWQWRFYDHIIRNEKSLQKIRQYIYNNPQKWDLDRNNPYVIQQLKNKKFLTFRQGLVD